MFNQEKVVKGAKSIVTFNKIFIFLQLLFICISLLFNFILDDSAVFYTLFFHTAFFIIYNIYAANVVENYISMNEEYYNILNEKFHWRHLKHAVQIHRLAKTNNDNITEELIEQAAVKVITWFIHLAAMLLLVPRG